MCGITGFIDQKATTSAEVLNRMNEVLHHRGPDGGQMQLLNFGETHLGMGHRRLAIIDLSENGTQPMKYKDLWITFNGEIYNFEEIKAELVSKGHSFRSESDTEMILHAYEEWGEKCLDKFVGMFAIVIFDLVKGEFFMARDRAGVKPLFLYQKDGLLLYSSELKSFHEHPDFQKKINLNAVASYMQFGHVPTPHCIFEDCCKVLPGHYLIGSIKTGEYVQHEYWSVYDQYNRPKLNLSLEDAKKETRNTLKKAFEYRMVADVPVGVFLSGGYDSVSVVSLLQSERTQKLKTYTIAVPDIGLNEAPFAKEIAEHLGTEHTEIQCSTDEAKAIIPGLPFHYDEPFGDSSAIPTTLVSLAARKHVTVALSADGGDEIFAGYNRYDYLMRHGKKIAGMPKGLRNIAASMMDVVPAERIPLLKNKYNFHNRYEKLKGVLRDPSPEKIMLSLSTQFRDDQWRSLFNSDVLPLNTQYDSKRLSKEFYTPLSYMMAIDYTTYMLDDILQKVDRATMTASLEGREPFMDQHIIELVSQLPDEFKYRNGEKKFLLKEIVHDHVPKSMMDRPKMGFAIPVADWLRNDLIDLLEEYISEKRISEEGIFNWNEIKKIKQEFLSGKKELDVKIWYLLMFEMWMEKWG
jgi:asparagine synthase (glutamine-hydrolysing)